MDVIHILSKQPGGITIGCHIYNAFCYADDIFLTSKTVSGLQALINSVLFIENHGLLYDLEKQSFFIKGKIHFILNQNDILIMFNYQHTILLFILVLYKCNNVNDNINAMKKFM